MSASKWLTCSGRGWQNPPITRSARAKAIIRLMALPFSLALLAGNVSAVDRTTYDEGSRPRVLINWESFVDNGFPNEWKAAFQNIVINSYTRLNRIGAVDVRPQFYGYTTRTDSNPGEIVISANERHANSTRLASAFGSYPDRIKIVMHRKRGSDLTPWNWTPFWPNNGEYSMQAVMMHELQHALGLDHSASTKNIMGSYSWKSHHGPWSGDLTDVRALYRLREQNRLRQLASYDGGANWSTLAADITGFGPPWGRTTNRIAVGGNTGSAEYLVGWTTVDNRLSWVRGDGVSFPTSQWHGYSEHPRPRYGSAMDSDNNNAWLWAVVDGQDDENRVRVIRSNDNGDSWNYTGFPSAVTSSTPGLARVRLGQQNAWVVAWVNFDEADRANTGYIYASVSFNNGASWSAPHAVDTFYRVQDGVSIGADNDGNLRFHFAWAGEKGTWAYGQNKLRSFTASISPAGVVSRGTLCFGGTHSRIAPDIAFHASTGRMIEGFREQDFNTSMNSRSISSGACPASPLHISSSTSHAAPGMGDNAAWGVPGVGSEVVMWRVNE